ncbi:MAG: hypothetical protein JW800_01335 [Candidatus Omnitrophica bacterium]|nr:hypothetical protein [Candidatus Omnitrophota bacterium]
MDRATKGALVFILLVFLMFAMSLFFQKIPGLDLSRYGFLFKSEEPSEPDIEYFGEDLDMGGSIQEDIHDTLYNDERILDNIYNVHPDASIDYGE